MRCNNQHLNVRIYKAIKDVVWETWNPVATTTERKLHTISLGRAANVTHRNVKNCQIPPTQTDLTSLVIGYVLKVFNPSSLTKEIAHFSNAFACRRTSSAETRVENPLSISAALYAAS